MDLIIKRTGLDNKKERHGKKSIAAYHDYAQFVEYKALLIGQLYLAQVKNATLQSIERNLGPVGQTEFLAYAGHVVLDCLFAYEKGFADISITQSAGNILKDFAFAWTKAFKWI